MKKTLKLVHFWQSYMQNGLIALHALFEVHCPGERYRFRLITCVWWTTAVIHCCYFKKRVIQMQSPHHSSKLSAFSLLSIWNFIATTEDMLFEWCCGDFVFFIKPSECSSRTQETYWSSGNNCWHQGQWVLWSEALCCGDSCFSCLFSEKLNNVRGKLVTNNRASDGGL